MEFCIKNNLPRRNHKIVQIDTIKTTNKAINGTILDFNELKEVIENLSDGESYEIVFHPGKYDPESKSSLNKQREDDVKKIEQINPFFEKNNIKLINFNELISI